MVSVRSCASLVAVLLNRTISVNIRRNFGFSALRRCAKIESSVISPYSNRPPSIEAPKLMLDLTTGTSSSLNSAARLG